jgi:hypothetical protein
VKFTHVCCEMFVYKVQITALQITALTTGTYKTLHFLASRFHTARCACCKGLSHALQNSSVINVFLSSVF